MVVAQRDTAGEGRWTRLRRSFANVDRLHQALAQRFLQSLAAFFENAASARRSRLCASKSLT